MAAVEGISKNIVCRIENLHDRGRRIARLSNQIPVVNPGVPSAYSTGARWRKGYLGFEIECIHNCLAA